MVLLELLKEYISEELLDNFNPSMVLLERQYHVLLQRQKGTFQSQYGLIRTLSLSIVSSSLNEFQSQYGLIRTLFSDTVFHIFYTFQSQYGLIRTSPASRESTK